MSENRTKSRVVFELEPDLKSWLQQYCRETGHTVTWVLTQLVRKHRDKVCKTTK